LICIALRFVVENARESAEKPSAMTDCGERKDVVMDRNVGTKGNVFVGGERRSWQEIDRELRAIAKRQRALDAEEAVLLCVVVRREIWRQLGKASLLEYLEEVLGYGPKAAKERVRVALALDELPRVADALASPSRRPRRCRRSSNSDIRRRRPVRSSNRRCSGFREARHSKTCSRRHCESQIRR
jgi:hypothetical protein